MEEYGNILTRHQGKANMVFWDGHVESPALKFPFEDTSDTILVRWLAARKERPVVKAKFILFQRNDIFY